VSVALLNHCEQISRACDRWECRGSCRAFDIIISRIVIAMFSIAVGHENRGIGMPIVRYVTLRKDRFRANLCEFRAKCDAVHKVCSEIHRTVYGDIVI